MLWRGPGVRYAGKPGRTERDIDEAGRGRQLLDEETFEFIEEALAPGDGAGEGGR